MSYIDKLSIVGVRSFDNRVSETIQFFSPLTLIVGFNGSGKTTIIECLKYATTGELPANCDRGKSFIHDPNLCGEKEVLAQVKISFKSTSGVKMVATRSLQLTVKKTAKTTTRKLKALEGQLLMIKDGERTAISSRVAELNQILPQYLGISTAILDYVVFCHQDDSLWPMSEPSLLKKRFDEIFEALKYTKAIDSLALLQKRQREELGKFRIIEQHSKEDKDKGERAEKRSSELFDEIEKLRTQAKDLETRMKTAAERSREAWDHAAKFQNIVSKLDGKRIEAAAIGRNVEELRRNIKEMTETDEELQSHLDRYEERVALYQRDNETQRKRYSDIAEKIEQNRRVLGVKQSEHGKYQAQKDQYEQQVQNREALIKETARHHHIRGFDLEVTNEHVQDFMERIGRMAKDQQSALDRVRRQNREDVQQAQKELNQLSERKAALYQSKDNSKLQTSANDKKVTELQAKLDKIDIDEGGKAILGNAVDDVESRLKEAKAVSTAARWDEKIRDANIKMRELEDQKEQLDAEMVEGTRRARDSAKLDYVQKELEEAQGRLGTMTSKQGNELSDVVGQSWEPRTLESDFQAALNQKSNALRDAELQRDGTNRELEQVQFQLTSAKDDLKKKLEELERREKQIVEVLEEPPETFPEELGSAQKSYDIAMQDATSFGNMKDYYESSLAVLEKHNSCNLCRRPFRNDREKNSFASRIESKVREAVDETYQETVKEAEDFLSKLRELQPSYDSWVRLKDTEIPGLEAACRTHEARHGNLLAKVEEQDHVVNERQESKRDVEATSKTAQRIVKEYTDIRSLEEQIEELLAKPNQTGASRGVEKIQDDLKQIGEQARAVKATLTHLSTERERARDRINNLEIELRDVRTRLTNAEHQLKEKSSVQAQLQELKAQNTECRETMRGADRDLQKLAPQIEQAQAKLDDMSQRGADKENELQTECSKIKDSLNHVTLANRDIDAYVGRGGSRELAEARQDIEKLEEEARRMEYDQRQITADVKKIEEQLRNHTDTKRAITDNIRYRAAVRQLEEVQAEIEELKAHNAEVDKDRYEREAGKWQNERNRLSAEQASIVGTLKSKDDQLTQLLQDWETDYKDAAYKYKEAHIKVETTKAAVEDLGRYRGALDKAIVKYHSIKLEEINRIIEELWKKTYQGTDVDSIMIRSENETTVKNRSYNYRVVMVKQDAEMDMRGRCSAGQRVLASIIIRLALAECFGVNCGLIALDEPTTNLDRDNIRALAESLAEIIRVRRQQSNFQLIVITHDEEFLRYMQCADFSDYYYRVSRNDKQKSEIAKQSIAEVL